MKKILLLVVIISLIIGMIFIVKGYNKRKYAYNKENYIFKSEKDKKIIKKRYLEEKRSEYEKKVEQAKFEEEERRTKDEDFLSKKPIKRERENQGVLKEKLEEKGLDMVDNIIILEERYNIEKDKLKRANILSVMINYYKEINKAEEEFVGRKGSVEELEFYRGNFIEENIGR